MMLVRRLDDCEEFIAVDGSRLRELLHHDKQDLRLGYSLARALAAPGMTTIPHRLNRSEVYYIVSGRGTMHIDGESEPVGPGAAVYIPPGSTQFIENTGDAELEFICIVDPAWRPEGEEVLRP